MSRFRLLGISVVGLLILNLSLVGFLFFRQSPDNARRMGGPPPFENEGPKRRIIELLRFDDQQVQQYEKLIGQHMNSIAILNQDIRKTKSDLYQSLVEENSPARDSLINTLSTLQKEIENTHYDHFLEIRRLCRPDQLDKFNSLTGELADFFGSEKDGRRPPR